MENLIDQIFWTTTEIKDLDFKSLSKQAYELKPINVL